MSNIYNNRALPTGNPAPSRQVANADPWHRGAIRLQGPPFDKEIQREKEQEVRPMPESEAERRKFNDYLAAQLRVFEASAERAGRKITPEERKAFMKGVTDTFWNDINVKRSGL